MKSLHKAALIRAYRCTLNTLLSLIPAGITINFAAGIDWFGVLMVILGMICTSFISGCICYLRAVVDGLPEVMDDEYDELELYLTEENNGLGESQEVE